MGHVQSTSVSWFSGSGNTEAITLTGVTAHNLLALGIGWASTATITSVNGGAVLIDTATDGTIGAGADYYVKDSSAGTITLTVVFSSDPGSGLIAISEVSGMDTVSPLDQHVANVQTTAGVTANAVTSSNVTTTAADYLWAFSFNDNFGGAINAGTGYTPRVVDSTFCGTVADQTQGAAGSTKATFTNTDASAHNLTFLAAFKAAGGGASGYPMIPTLTLTGVQ